MSPMYCTLRRIRQTQPASRALKRLVSPSIRTAVNYIRHFNLHDFMDFWKEYDNIDGGVPLPNKLGFIPGLKACGRGLDMAFLHKHQVGKTKWGPTFYTGSRVFLFSRQFRLLQKHDLQEATSESEILDIGAGKGFLMRKAGAPENLPDARIACQIAF